MAEYIDCEAAVNAVLNLVPKVDDDGYCWVIRGDAARAIDSIPAADVRPVVRGRWIETKTGFHCSVCKSKAKGTKDGALLSNFCPNCGAMMEKS